MKDVLLTKASATDRRYNSRPNSDGARVYYTSSTLNMEPVHFMVLWSSRMANEPSAGITVKDILPLGYKVRFVFAQG